MFARHFNHYCRSDYIEEEASLSGDDVGSDDDEDEGPDEYEEEEGDKEDLPDAETIREQLHKQWLKQQQDEEHRRLLYWKDQLLADGDLHSETNRTFRLKLRDEEDLNEIDVNDDEGQEDEAEDDEARKKRLEMVKWKIENKVTFSGSESRSGSQSFGSGISKNSLLAHRSSLSLIVNQVESTSASLKKGLFVNKTKEVLLAFATSFL
ncbi:unnamed protein product [Enterobius vermicularis]|uniref:AATF-Che1 domain-containing protein n=1 Tax=Enterobius vermicularis TaxID=51028 RepID=A0A0N4V2Y2_ENTVE|nr:unnamed protein product [Enterobius vermicularis]